MRTSGDGRDGPADPRSTRRCLGPISVRELRIPDRIRCSGTDSSYMVETELPSCREPEAGLPACLCSPMFFADFVAGCNPQGFAESWFEPMPGSQELFSTKDRHRYNIGTASRRIESAPACTGAGSLCSASADSRRRWPTGDFGAVPGEELPHDRELMMDAAAGEPAVGCVRSPELTPANVRCFSPISAYANGDAIRLEPM